MASAPATTLDPHTLLADYQRVRQDSQFLCEPLEIEDYGIQTMADVSPPKWHLAHTSWFFETFLLHEYFPGYQEFHPQFKHLFNSYYNSIGEYHPRPQRGLLSRPTVREVYAYRDHIDAHMVRLLSGNFHETNDSLLSRTRLGLHHEQQHQELLLTDIKHIFATNPLKPVYRESNWKQDREPVADGVSTIQKQWQAYEGGVMLIGHNAGNDGFTFDNEQPRHKVYIDDFQLDTRLVTNAEYLAFMDDGAYDTATLWLSDAWTTVRNLQWRAPLYWEQRDGQWWHMTLAGMQPVDMTAPVCHVSFYEAEAYARWAGARLPSEAEWETVASQLPIAGNFRDSGLLQPRAAADGPGMQQLYGDVWEWMQSPYGAYPGYHPAAGALGEYNGKFMSNQIVLRGGSCVTPQDHIRPTYRNFFYPGDRWQFSGFRLAKDIV